MITIQGVARRLLYERQAHGNLLFKCDIIHKLGHEGFAEAIKRRWIIDAGDGNLSVNTDGGMLLRITEEANGDVQNGENVVVNVDGKAYQGIVRSRNSDGSIFVDFAGENRPPQERPYRKEEVSRIETTQQQQPARAAAAAPSPVSSAPAASAAQRPAPTSSLVPGVGRV